MPAASEAAISKNQEGVLRSALDSLLVTFDGELPEAEAGQAVTLVLEDEVDIGRGDLLVHSNQLALVSNKLNVDVIWMSETAMIPKKQYDFKFASKVVSGSFSA
mgnify:CR=1 FL=1